MIGLFRKSSPDNNEQRHTYSFVPAGTSQKVLIRLTDNNILFSNTVPQLVEMGFLNRALYKYLDTSVPVEIVPDSDSMNVMCGKRTIGSVPKKNLNHVRYALENDCRITAHLSGGPYKIIKERYDDHGHPSRYTEKHDDDIRVKVLIEY